MLSASLNKKILCLLFQSNFTNLKYIYAYKLKYPGLATEDDEFKQFKKSNRRNEWMFNDTPARKTDRLLGVRKR